MMDKNHQELLTLVALLNGRADLEDVVRDIRPIVMRAMTSNFIAGLDAKAREAWAAHEAARKSLQDDVCAYAEARVNQHFPFTVTSARVARDAGEITAFGTLRGPDRGFAVTSFQLNVPGWYHDRKVQLDRLYEAAQQADAIVTRSRSMVRQGCDDLPGVDVSSLLFLSAAEKATLEQVKSLLDTIQVNVAAL